MASFLKSAIVALLAFCSLLGCTKSEPPIVKELEKRMSAAQEKLQKIEELIKKVPEQDQGKLLQLLQDKQLALSRLERIKENILAIAPDRATGAQSEKTEHE